MMNNITHVQIGEIVFIEEWCQPADRRDGVAREKRFDVSGSPGESFPDAGQFVFYFCVETFATV